VDYLLKRPEREAKIRTTVETTGIDVVSAEIHKTAREATVLFSRPLTATQRINFFRKRRDRFN
jgi:hypothetical protein